MHTVPDTLHSVEEAADIASMSPEAIRRLIRLGRLPTYGTGDDLKVKLSELLPPYVPRRRRQ